MSILKITILSQKFVINEVFANSEIDGIEGSNKLIYKYRKLLKTETLSKS